MGFGHKMLVLVSHLKCSSMAPPFKSYEDSNSNLKVAASHSSWLQKKGPVFFCHHFFSRYLNPQNVIFWGSLKLFQVTKNFIFIKKICFLIFKNLLLI